MSRKKGSASGSKKNKKGKAKKSHKPNVEFQLLDYIKTFPNKRFSYKALVKKYDRQHDKGEVMAAIHKLLDKNKIEKLGANTVRMVVGKRSGSKHDAQLRGELDMSRHGYGYVICPDLDGDVFISEHNLNKAMHKDKVTFRVTHTGRNGRREGTITSIEKRQQDKYVGIIQRQADFAFVVPDSDKVPTDIFIPKELMGNAKDGTKVVVQVTGWPDKFKNPVGKIVEELGNSGEHDVEMRSILIQNGFSLTFPEEVVNETDEMPDIISEEEIAKRADMRGTLTFTIDPEDAKDFDDALSFKELKNGKYEIGVHIADVSHYVKPDTALDKEAYDRATSVYLVDRVAPMLPEKISNVLCSLRPNEDKLAFSAVFTMDADATVTDVWYGRTVIHSDHRFTYRSAQDVLDSGEGKFAKELQIMNQISLKMRAERMKTGSIGFESQEVRFKLDEDGKPLEVVVKEILPTNELIEDYMLLANKYVAKFISQLKGAKEPPPNVFRVHDTPDLTKLEQFAEFARKFGHHVKFTNDPKHIAEVLNTLLKKIQGKPEGVILSALAIRTMSKAYYTTKNIGHYGLAFEHYSHFTSPIRRYPDLLVHRILENVLTKQKPPYDQGSLEEMCGHCSLQERNAMSAERESVKYKQVEYMSERIGEEFDGIISGVIARGIFVELVDNKCEGFIPENKLGGFSMNFDEATLTITDADTGDRFQFGDKIRVRVVSTNLERRIIDFELAPETDADTDEDSENERPAPRSKPRSKAKPEPSKGKKKKLHSPGANTSKKKR